MFRFEFQFEAKPPSNFEVGKTHYQNTGFYETYSEAANAARAFEKSILRNGAVITKVEYVKEVRVDVTKSEYWRGYKPE